MNTYAKSGSLPCSAHKAEPVQGRVRLKEAAQGRSYEDGAAMLRPGASGVAAAGFAGPSVALPHKSAIEQSYGADMSSVRAYTGPAAAQACRKLGAQAYASGNQIAFASETPSLHVAAHEAAHTLQDVGLAGDIGGAGDVAEQQADAAADRVVAGQSAKDVLPQGARVTGASEGTVRFYTIPTIKGSQYRVSDDANIAVRQDSKYGSKAAYAHTDVIAAAASAKSALSVSAGSGSLTVTGADGRGTRLSKVMVNNGANKSRGAKMSLWADCGRSTRCVSGADGGSGQGSGSLNAAYRDPKGAVKTGMAAHSPEIHKVEIMCDYFGAKLDMKKIRAYFDEYVAWGNKMTTNKAEEDERDAAVAWYADQLDRLSRAEWDKLTDDEKKQVEKAAGINRYADPGVGDAYHMSSGGNTHPDLALGESTWNFHWAGVVMKSGGDNVTLENYATDDYDETNTNWDYQMYGVHKHGGSNKAGQTFQEQHRDVHKQHGTDPTTMHVVKP